MGFLDLFRKDCEPEPERPIEVKGEDILDWFEENFQDELESLDSKTRKRYSEIEKSFQKIQNAAGKLEGAVFKGHKKMRAAAGMIRDDFVRKIKTSPFPDTPENTELISASDFCSEAQSHINKLLKLSPKQNLFLSKCFKKESYKVISSIKRTRENLSEFREFLKQAKIMQLRNELEKHQKKREEMDDSLTEEKRKSEKLDKKIRSGKKKLKKLESSLDDLLASKKWTELRKSRVKLKETKNRIKKTESEIRNDLSGIKRPLKKLAHLEGKDIIQPFEEVMAGRTNTVLDMLKKIKNNKKLSLKPKKLEKIDQAIGKLDSEIPDLLKKHSKLLEERDKTENKISEFNLKEQKEKLKNRIEKSKKKFENLKEKAQNSRKKAKGIRKKLLKLKEKTERTVFENTGKKIKIPD